MSTAIWHSQLGRIVPWLFRWLCNVFYFNKLRVVRGGSTRVVEGTAASLVSFHLARVQPAPIFARMQLDEANPLRLGDYLSTEGICLDLKSRQRDEILKELINTIPQLRGLASEKEKLFHALKEREELCSTGVGDGVAFPHARSAMVGLVDEPVIVFGRTANGVPFGAVDGTPVKLFFLVIAPNVTTHLRILARLSRLLRDPHLRSSLITAEHASRVLSLIKVNEVDLVRLPSNGSR